MIESIRVLTRPGKMRVHLENLEKSWDFVSQEKLKSKKSISRFLERNVADAHNLTTYGPDRNLIR